MALSEHEQQMLREIEQSLLAEDPKFGASVRREVRQATAAGASLRGIALIVVGLLLLLGGVALAQQNMWFVALSVVGFIVMFGASVWMLNGGGKKNAPAAVASARRRPQPAAEGKGLSGRMEDNFRRRFEQ
ncbi:MAG: DUF3040 domain-containing protein [Corynebacterium sp.]|nr:DUF3040 domain-containing protein [Corynebacterium sp.]